MSNHISAQKRRKNGRWPMEREAAEQAAKATKEAPPEPPRMYLNRPQPVTRFDRR